MSEIKDYVIISFEAKPTGVMVNDRYLNVDISCDSLINPPENKDQIRSIVWDISKKYHPLSKGCMNFTNGQPILFNDEKYNDWVQPFVDIWQAKKDEQQQEQEEIEAELNKFENRQARALNQLNADFETVKERAHIKSSLGFTVDANQTANENVNGLLVTIGSGTVQFCDYYNQFHELTKADLETLQNEIIQNAQNLYQQKWVYRTQIENCTDNEGLDAVTEAINFTYMDFTPADTGDGGEAAEQA